MRITVGSLESDYACDHLWSVAKIIFWGIPVIVYLKGKWLLCTYDA